MSKNKLYNQSYFCKRIIEAGFDIIRLNIPYMYEDLRKWTVVVNKHGISYKHNILITCFKNEETKEFSFKFQGPRFDDFILPTLSMNLIIDILKKTTEAKTEQVMGNNVND